MCVYICANHNNYIINIISWVVLARSKSIFIGLEKLKINEANMCECFYTYTTPSVHNLEIAVVSIDL